MNRLKFIANTDQFSDSTVMRKYHEVFDNPDVTTYSLLTLSSEELEQAGVLNVTPYARIRGAIGEALKTQPAQSLSKRLKRFRNKVRTGQWNAS